MPRHDYTCPNCKTVRRDVWTSIYRDATNTRDPVICDCGQEMIRLPAAPNFTIHGFNAKNGYSK